MWGALVGDCIGSFWEMSGNKDPAIPLWVPACRFTDDSVCTAAVAAWLKEDPQGSVATLTPILHAAARQYQDRGFASRMRAWAQSDDPQPYGSWGNGAAMRVSPIALHAPTDEIALAWAARSTAPTHNHPESVRGAQAVVWAIREAFRHRDPDRLVQDVAQKFDYPQMLTLDLEHERWAHAFDVSVQGTVPLALVIAARAGSFRAAMNASCSMGGDADTLASIAGPVAEALYGIPEVDVLEAQRRFKDAPEIWAAVEGLYAAPTAQTNLDQWGRSEGTRLGGFSSTLPSGVRSRLR